MRWPSGTFFLTPNCTTRDDQLVLGDTAKPGSPDVVPSRRDGDVARLSGGGNTNPAQKIFGSTLDTQFIPVMIGLDWVF